MVADQAALYLSTSKLPKGTWITLARVTDQQGRPVRIGATSHRGTEHGFALDPAADVKRLNLTFAVHKSRYVEFLAKPAGL